MKKIDTRIIRLLIKSIKGGFGPRCKDTVIGCPTCTAYRLIDYLEWYKDLLED